MKKLIIPGSLLLALALTIVIACNKDTKDSSAPKKEQQVGADQLKTLSATTLGGTYMTNATYGFLIFADTGKMNAYLKELVGTTHQEIRNQQTSTGFTSLGTSYYSSISGTDTVTEDQAPLYFMNSDGIVQIQGVILKQMNQTSAKSGWDYFLTLLPQNLNAQRYASLASGTYVSGVMNKFADGEVLNKGLFKFMQSTPSGHQATSTASTTGKFWGTTLSLPYDVPCPNPPSPECSCMTQTVTTYIFWIVVDSHPIDPPYMACPQ